ncbi:hypothetical protein F2Q70_00045556 [Brassica cretica]|uniref:Uncharacterized protein n=1 Tax=Brassica cretica TaxID=69181 RepID=A0A8S9KG11_BRACR|nr:hypothetical protein F2Q70_00045556 [Brassica cretica]
MRLKFIAAMDTLATAENQRSSQRGMCFDAESPEAFDTMPTSAVSAKWNPVSVVANTQERDPSSLSRKFIKIMRFDKRTEAEPEAGGRHELFISHDDPHGADDVHAPCSDVGD